MDFKELLTALWPLLVLQIVVMIWALADLIRRKQVRGLPKFAWGIIIVVVNILGPVAYFIAGRGEE